MIWDLVSVYWLAIVCSVVAGVSLSVIGSYLAARDLSMKVLVVGQSASVGYLLGTLALFSETSIFASVCVFVVGVHLLERLVLRKVESGNSTILLVFFVTLAASSHWLVNFFPQLEIHATESIYGDLVTVSGLRLWICLLTSAFVWIYLQWKKRSIVQDTFQQVIFEKKDLLPKSKQSFNAFLFFSFGFIIVSVFSLGMIFTLAALFIPTVVLNLFSLRSLKSHLAWGQIIAGLGTILGFFASLRWEKLSTVPTVVLSTLIVSILLGSLAKAAKT